MSMLYISMDKRFKLGVAFNICLIIFFGLFTIYHLHTLSEHVREKLQHDIDIIDKSDKLADLISRTVEKSARIDAAIATADTLKQLQMSQSLVSDILDLKKRAESLLGENNKVVNSVFRHQLVTVFDKSDAIKDIAGYLKNPSALGSHRQEMIAKLGDLRREISSLKSQKILFITQSQEGLSKLSQDYQSRMAIAIIVALFLASVAIYLLSHQIKLPTRRIVAIIRRIRDGQYSIPIRKEEQDEVDQIIVGLASMAGNLRIRDQLRIDKIKQEKKRFATLANILNAPLMLINEEKKVAFANNELLTLFKLSIDDLFEIELPKTPLPAELKLRLQTALSEKQHLENEPFDAIGENYAYELYITLLPVKLGDDKHVSTIVILGKFNKKCVNPMSGKQNS